MILAVVSALRTLSLTAPVAMESNAAQVVAPLCWCYDALSVGWYPRGSSCQTDSQRGAIFRLRVFRQAALFLAAITLNGLGE